jgi:hypothetical protein
MITMSSAMQLSSWWLFLKYRIIGSRARRNRGLWRRSVTGVGILALAMLGGCASVRLGYGNGSTLGYWTIDHYLDFSREQAGPARAAVEQWFTWHRSQQLGADLALLEQLRREVQGELTPAQVCAWAPVLQQWSERALTQLVPATTALLPTLSSAQIAHLQDRYERSNRDWAKEHLQPDAQERLQAQLERTIKNAERLYGRLDREQKRWLEGQLARSVWQPEQALAERQARQQATLQTLRQFNRAGSAPSAEAVRALLLSLIEPVDEAARQRREAFLTERCQLTAELHRRTSAVQRRQAAETLAGWQADLRGFLPAEAASATPR